MGYVYFLKGSNSFYKIGRSSNVESRLSALNGSNYDVYQVVTTKLVENPQEFEYQLHQKYKEYLAKEKREWFEFPPEIAIQVCIEINNGKGVEMPSENKQLRTIESKIDRILSRSQTSQNYNHNNANPLLAALLGLQDLPKRKEPKTKIVPIKIERVSDRLNDDYLVEKAVEVVRAERTASSSLLQRRLSIGYARAARIMDMLEMKGYVTPQDGAKARNVLIDNLPRINKLEQIKEGAGIMEQEEIKEAKEIEELEKEIREEVAERVKQRRATFMPQEIK